jgi:hypothetical protein
MSSEVKMASLRKPSTDGMNQILSSTLYHVDSDEEEEESEAAAGDEEAAPLSRTTATARRRHSKQGRSSSRVAVASLLPGLGLERGLSDFSLLSTAMEDDADDNGIGLISAEDYMKFRLLPAIKRLNDTIPRHERWYNSSQGLILFATMMASVCGVVGLHVWIPAVAASVAGVESLVHFDQTSARLVGANGALTQLKNLRIWWQSLSRTQQSMPHNKAQLIEGSEDAIESELSAWTQGILRKKRKVDAAEEGEEEEGGWGAEKKKGSA